MRRLLDDNVFLHDYLFQEIRGSKEALCGILKAVELVVALQSCLTAKAAHPWSDLYVEAMTGNLRNFVPTTSLILSVQKLPSDNLQSLLDKLSSFPLHDLSTIAGDLQNLISNQGKNAAPLRSEFDIDSGTLRTTIVAQKVKLSKQSSNLSKQDIAYTGIVKRVATMLEDFFDSYLIDPRDLFLHEVLVYDLNYPYRDVFIPNPRHAIERALSSPHDYLGCSCCNGTEQGLSATQPATAILYQLYLESGAIVNISDLWSAFQTIVGDDNAEDEGADQERSL